MTCDCFVIKLWLQLLTRCCLFQELLANRQHLIEDSVPTPETLLFIWKWERGLVIAFSVASASQSRPVDGVIALVFGHGSSNHYARPLGLIYCTTPSTGQIAFLEKTVAVASAPVCLREREKESPSLQCKKYHGRDY